MKQNDVPPGYIERLFKAFYITNRQIQQDMAQSFKELHLTGPQFYILYLLCQEGGAKPTELADKLEVKPSAITVMVDRLIKGGLVRRERDEDDRRIVKLDSTEEGRAIFEKAKVIRKEIFTRYLSYLEEADIEQLVMTYEKLAAIIEHTKGENERVRTTNRNQ